MYELVCILSLVGELVWIILRARTVVILFFQDKGKYQVSCCRQSQIERK